VGRPVAGPVRVALQVDNVDAATAAAVDGGAELVGAPVDTPWGSRNSRLDAPGEVHLTLFEDRSAMAE
jgi:lactoylglutathione lyase